MAISRTLSGAPQGGVVSPVLSNIYLDRLDDYIETGLCSRQYNQGDRTQSIRPYMRLWRRAWEREQRGDRAGGRELRRQMRTMPCRDPPIPATGGCATAVTPTTGCSGSPDPRPRPRRSKAPGAFLHDELDLELSQDKTLITHGRTRPARFLGYEVTVLHADRKVTARPAAASTERSASGCPHR